MSAPGGASLWDLIGGFGTVTEIYYDHHQRGWWVAGQWLSEEEVLRAPDPKEAMRAALERAKPLSGTLAEATLENNDARAAWTRRGGLSPRAADLLTLYADALGRPVAPPPGRGDAAMAERSSARCPFCRTLVELARRTCFTCGAPR